MIWVFKLYIRSPETQVYTGRIINEDKDLLIV